MFVETDDATDLSLLLPCVAFCPINRRFLSHVFRHDSTCCHTKIEVVELCRFVVCW